MLPWAARRNVVLRREKRKARPSQRKLEANGLRSGLLFRVTLIFIGRRPWSILIPVHEAVMGFAIGDNDYHPCGIDSVYNQNPQASEGSHWTWGHTSLQGVKLTMDFDHFDEYPQCGNAKLTRFCSVCGEALDFCFRSMPEQLGFPVFDITSNPPPKFLKDGLRNLFESFRPFLKEIHLVILSLKTSPQPLLGPCAGWKEKTRSHEQIASLGTAKRTGQKRLGTSSALPNFWSECQVVPPSWMRSWWKIQHDTTNSYRL